MKLSTCENVTSILKKLLRGETSLQHPCVQPRSESLFLGGWSHLISTLALPLSRLTSLKDADWSGHILAALELFKMDPLEFSLEIWPVELEVSSLQYRCVLFFLFVFVTILNF